MRQLGFLIWTGLSALCATAPAAAKQIYKWTDANGVVHFSDVAPPNKAGIKNLSARLIDVDPSEPVRVRQESTRGAPNAFQYFAYNDLSGPASVLFEPSEAIGVAVEPALPLLLTLPSKREVQALSVRAVGGGGTFSMRYRWTPGDPNAVPDPAAVYRLPYPAGQRFAIHQAFGGSFSHSGLDNYHAVDFAMPKGSDVTAARAGIVMQVQDDFYRNGTDLNKYGERANVVVIVHSDGTLGSYAHLDLDSVVVSPGRRVDAGQLLGKSGNTGFSTGPHLHFVVQRNDRGELKSVPFAFTVAGKRITPAAGEALGE